MGGIRPMTIHGAMALGAAQRAAAISCRGCGVAAGRGTRPASPCAALSASASRSFATVHVQMNKALYREEQAGAGAGRDPMSGQVKRLLMDLKGMQQVEGRPTPDMVEASRSIRACKARGDWAAALEHLRLLETPSFFMHALTLDVVTHALRYREAWELWKAMPSIEHNASRVSAYGMMIKMCGKLKRVHDAEELFGEMQRAGLEPSIVTYSSMITAYAMVGKWEEASELLAQIRGSGEWAEYETTSKQIVINGAITACARKGKYDEARKLMESMRSEGIPVQHSHYNALLTACVSGRDAATADAVIAEMRAAGLEPRVADLTIRMASSLEDLRTCEALFQEILDKQLKPNRFTFEALSESALLAGEAARASELLVRARAECTMPPTKKTEQLEADVAAAVRGASSPAAAVETRALPGGWSSTLCPSSGAPYYWRDADPASTVTWVHP
mmetsp:Transcript_92653/g.262268  ORF Transcript_92653/g.262268 Transcript_92653/m.262268 type:complete len:448 (-) Transcript_92653:105-1448(-)